MIIPVFVHFTSWNSFSVNAVKPLRFHDESDTFVSSIGLGPALIYTQTEHIVECFQFHPV